uniref:ATP synthase subunit a n=1 Tax=Romanomermis nielseni TaxID=416167 RepID=A1Z399_9BILA|nr:ATP synthase F0 subunit 6 [Romanomermis nielseni]ABL73782.1 ATP synthase F0 subunit 6 [Romanomermis nielseni]
MMSPFQFLSMQVSFPLLIFVFFINKMNLFNKFILKFQIFEVLLFSLILFNLFGMLPFFWSIACYIWSNLLLSLLIWGVMFFSLLFKFLKLFMSHLLPYGSPVFLWWFLIALEMVSQLIRPVTLSLRLMCNLIAGHVMISLISFLSFKYFILLIIFIFFEMMVALIQSVVYSLLNLIYFKEMNN